MSVLDRALHSPEYLRQQRTRLFKAFDILKENVNFGIDELTQERKEEILVWYHKALDLDYDAMNEYPSELDKYL